MSDWREVPLGEVLTLQRGFDITKKSQRPGTVPVVSSSGVNSFHSESRADGPGVVIGRKGSLGTTFFVNEPYWPHDTTLWVKDFRGNDPYFCFLLLRSLRLSDLDAGASNPTLNRNHAHLLPVTMPPRSVQLQIATVARAFEELIEINERRIELLEDLARSLYREWFVHHRFPEHEDVEFVQSVAGIIPSTWSVRMLGDIARTVNDGIDPRGVNDRGVYVGLEHLPRRMTTLRRWGRTDAVTSRKLRFERGDTLFGKIRPSFHKVVWAPSDGVASSDTVVLRSASDHDLPALVNGIASSDAFVAHAVGTSNGTKMPRADPSSMLAYPVALPDLGGPVIRHYEAIAREWLDLAPTLVSQNHQLVATRDLLLPRLVTGRIDISDLDLGDLQPAAAP